MLHSSIQSVVFDLDNTLMDRQRAIARWATREIRRRRPQASTRECRHIVRRFLEVDQWGQFPRSAVQWLADTVGSRHGSQSPDVWRRFHEELPRWIRPRSEAAQLLRWLVHARVPIAIGTNGGARIQRRKLAAAGLASFPWRTIAVSQQLGVAKPAAAFFRCLEQQLELPPRALLMVGDDWNCDVVGATDCGWNACWLSYGRSRPASLPTRGHVVRDFGELGRWLAPTLASRTAGPMARPPAECDSVPLTRSAEC